MAKRKSIPVPRELWVIYDPLDGPHCFKTEAQAKRQVKKWEKEADCDPFDSVWDMTGPYKYERVDA